MIKRKDLCNLYYINVYIYTPIHKNFIIGTSVHLETPIRKVK